MFWFSVWCFLYLKFFPKTESVKQKFTYSCLCGSNLCCALYWSCIHKKEKVERLGVFCLNHVVALSIQGQQPNAWLAALVELNWGKRVGKKGKNRVKGQSGLYGINLKEVDGPHANTVTSPVLDGQPHPRESITQWQWLTDRRSGVVAMLNG